MMRCCFVQWPGDKLLEKKKHFELLEPYDQRATAAANYLKSVRPALTVQTGALLDPKVPPLSVMLVLCI